MGISLQPCPAWADLEAEHSQWLSAFDQRYQQKWENVRKEDYEAALCEAAVRRMLQAQGITVEPNEDVAGKLPTGSESRPDFRCFHPDGNFLVEVTCISIATVVEQTDLPHPFQPGVQNYGSLNHAIFWKSVRKYKQYSTANLPTLLAVGTFHQLSALCMSRKFADMLLTGQTSLSWPVNIKTGQGTSDAIQTTELRASPFLKPGSLGEVRTSLSGLLLCGLGCDPAYVIGVMHPHAARPFNCNVLPSIQFGQVAINKAAGELNTSWPKQSEGEEEKAVLENFLT